MLTALATRGKLDSYGPIPDRVNVESDNDIIYYVYGDSGIITEELVGTLYRRASASDNYTIVDSQTIKGGDIGINLHDYGLQYQDSQFLLKVNLERNNNLVGETVFGYYYLKHTRIPKVVPYHADASYLQYTGGGGMGVAPIYKERPLPTVFIINIEEDEKTLENINIYINKIIDLSIGV